MSKVWSGASIAPLPSSPPLPPSLPSPPEPPCSPAPSPPPEPPCSPPASGRRFGAFAVPALPFRAVAAGDQYPCAYQGCQNRPYYECPCHQLLDNHLSASFREVLVTPLTLEAKCRRNMSPKALANTRPPPTCHACTNLSFRAQSSGERNLKSTALNRSETVSAPHISPSPFTPLDGLRTNGPPMTFPPCPTTRAPLTIQCRQPTSYPKPNRPLRPHGRSVPQRRSNPGQPRRMERNGTQWDGT